MVFPIGTIRVVHLVTSLNIGGLEMVVLNLARYADRRRFDLRVLCLEESGILAPRIESLGVPVESVGPPSLSRLRRLIRLSIRLGQMQPHILHTHNMMPHYFGAAAATVARVPVLIHTKHGRNNPELPRRVMLNRWASYLSSRVVAVSEDSADVARKIERVPDGKLTVIRNGINLEGFPPHHRQSAGKRVINVARLNFIKDQATLLRAARLVADADPEFRLDIIGDGPARGELLALREDLSLGDRVCFLGERMDVAGCLAACDLFVLSSETEGLSLTLLEAMAAGLPIVATAVGGNREVVVEGETGLLVPAKSPQALAHAIRCLLCDPARLLRMGRAARAQVEKEFDMRQVVVKYETLYRELLEKVCFTP
jgi:glycosyltransferase involved in cell wall biosynthesis